MYGIFLFFKKNSVWVYVYPLKLELALTNIKT